MEFRIFILNKVKLMANNTSKEKQIDQKTIQIYNLIMSGS